MDFQETWRGWPRNVVTWGAGYRVTSGRITAIATSVFDPPRRTDNLFSAFVQDEFALVPSKWRLTIGSKVEHNDYSAFEIQPTARVLWTPGRSTAAWGAITRAVRTPSRVETDFTTASFVSASPTLTFVRLLPNPDFQPENLVAYEVGYRARILPRLYITVSGFYNDLNDTLSTDLQPGSRRDSTGACAAAPDPARRPRKRHPGAQPRRRGDGRCAPGAVVARDRQLRVSRRRRLEGPRRDRPGAGADLRRAGASPSGPARVLVRRGGGLVNRLVPSLCFRPAGRTGAGLLGVRRPYRPSALAASGGLGGRTDLFADHHLEWTSTGKVEFNRSTYARVIWRTDDSFLMGRQFVVAILQVVHGQGTVAASPDRLTSQLQAAFVSKLPQFVEWPAPVLDGRTTIDGVRRASRSLRIRPRTSSSRAKTVNGKPIVARQVRKEQDLDECQVLFLPRRGSGPRPLLRRASTRPILTVSDDPSFLDDGGIILLRVVEGRIRFDVDVAAAQRVGLRISSQLLQLAATVGGGES